MDFIGGFTSLVNQQNINTANKQMAEKAYERDVEMWNRQNEYNNPASQMSRLKEAGLNPNLVYGSGQTVGNTASQLPRYQAPTMQANFQPPSSVLNELSAYADIEVKRAQAENLRQSGGKTGLEADIMRKSKDYIISLAKANTSKAWGQAKTAEFDSMLTYYLMGGKDGYKSDMAWEIPTRDFVEGTAWKKAQAETAKTQSDFDLTYERARQTKMDNDLSEKLREMGVNNETARLAISFLQMLRK